jgi:hypothetical protein
LGPDVVLVTHSVDEVIERSDMAAGTDMTHDTGAELAAHSSSYSLFVGLMKWGTIISAIVGFVVVFIFIA